MCAIIAATHHLLHPKRQLKEPIFNIIHRPEKVFDIQSKVIFVNGMVNLAEKWNFGTPTSLPSPATPQSPLTATPEAMVPARCRVKVALHHTYITLPQVASHIAGLRTRLKLGQEGKTKMFSHILKQKKRNWPYAGGVASRLATANYVAMVTAILYDNSYSPNDSNLNCHSPQNSILNSQSLTILKQSTIRPITFILDYKNCHIKLVLSWQHK